MSGRPGTRRAKRLLAEEESILPGSTATGTCSVVEISDADKKKRLEILTELSELELRNAGKNYDLNSCLSCVQLFMNLCHNPFENTAYLAEAELYGRLIKSVSRSILSGAWTAVPSEDRSKLRNSLSVVAAILKTSNFHNEEKYCWTGCHLINTSPWQDVHINKVLNEAVILDNVNRLFDKEGWIFIEARIELLCKLDPERLARLLEACLMKGQIWYPDLTKEKMTRNVFKMPQEKYYQVAAMFAIIVYKHAMDENNPFSRFDPYFTVLLVTGTARRLLDNNTPHRVQPTWRNWKHAKPVATELVLRQLQIINKKTTALPELKSFFKFYLKLLHFVRQDYSEELGAAALPYVFDTLPSGQDPPESLVQSVLDFSTSECFENLLKNSFTDDHIYALADAILELCGTTEPVLNKVVELYVTELTKEVRHRFNVQSMGDKEVTDNLSQVISRRFDSLAQYFEFDSQICFEILLSSFSLNPTSTTWNRIVNMVDSPSEESAKVDVNMKISASMHSKARLSSGVFIDLTNLIQGVRAARLTCFRDSWTRFKAVCENHLSTRGDDIKGVNDLALAKPTDFSAYIGMKPAYDDNDAGYEAGYLPVDDEEEENTDATPPKKPKKIREPAFRMKMFLQGSAPSTSSSFLVKKKSSSSSSKQVGELVKKAKGLKPAKLKPEAQLKLSNKLLSRKTQKPIAQVSHVRVEKTARRINAASQNSLPEFNYEEPRLHLPHASQKRKSTSKLKMKPIWPPQELFGVTEDGEVVLPCMPRPFASGGKSIRYSRFDQALDAVPYFHTPAVLSITQSNHTVPFPNYHQSHVLASRFSNAAQEVFDIAATNDNNFFPGEHDPSYSESTEEWTKFLLDDMKTESVSTLPSSRPAVEINSAENESIDESMEQDVSQVAFEEPEIEIETPLDNSKMELECQKESMIEDRGLLQLSSDSSWSPGASLNTVQNNPQSPGLQAAMESLLDQLSDSSLSGSDYSKAQASTECSPITSPENIAGTRLCLSVTTGKLIQEEYDSSSEVEDCDTCSFTGFSNDESEETDLNDNDDFDAATTLDSEEEPGIEVLSDVTGDVVSVNRTHGNRVYLSETVGIFFELDPKQLENLFSNPVDPALPPFEGFPEPDSPIFSPSRSIPDPDEYVGAAPVNVVLPMHVKVKLFKLTDQEIESYQKASLPAKISVPSPAPISLVKSSQRRKSLASPIDAPSEKKSRPESVEARRSNRISRPHILTEETGSTSRSSSPLNLQPTGNSVEKKRKVESNPKRSHKRKQKEPSACDSIIISHHKENKAEGIHYEDRVKGMQDFHDFLLRENEKVNELEPKMKVVANGLKQNGVIMLTSTSTKSGSRKRAVSTSLPSNSSNSNHRRLPAKRAKASPQNPEPQVYKNPPNPKIMRKVSTDYEMADDVLSDDFDDEEEVDPCIFPENDPEFMPESESESELELGDDDEDEVDNFVLTEDEDEDYLSGLTTKPKPSFIKQRVRAHSKGPVFDKPKWSMIVSDKPEPHVQDVEDFEIDPLAIEHDSEPIVITIDDSSDESDVKPEVNVNNKPLPQLLNLPQSLEVTFYESENNGLRLKEINDQLPQDAPPPDYILPSAFSSSSPEPQILAADSDMGDIIIPDFLEIEEVEPEEEIILVSPPSSGYQSSFRPPTCLESKIQNETTLPELKIAASATPESVIFHVASEVEVELPARRAPTSPEPEISNVTNSNRSVGKKTGLILLEQEVPHGSAELEITTVPIEVPQIQNRTAQPELEITAMITPESNILSVATKVELDIPVRPTSPTSIPKPEISDPSHQSVEKTTGFMPEREIPTGTAELEITTVRILTPQIQNSIAQPESGITVSEVPKSEIPNAAPQPELEITATEILKPEVRHAATQPELEITATEILKPEVRNAAPQPELEITATEIPNPELKDSAPEPELEITAAEIPNPELKDSAPEPELEITATEIPKPELKDSVPEPELEITATEIPKSELKDSVPQPELEITATEILKPEVQNAAPQPELEITAKEILKPEVRDALNQPELEITAVVAEPEAQDAGTQQEPRIPEIPRCILEHDVANRTSQPELQITTTWIPERRISMQLCPCPVEPMITAALVSAPEASARDLVEPAITTPVTPEAVDVDPKAKGQNLENEAEEEDEREMPQLDLAEATGAYFGEDYPDALPPRLQPQVCFDY